MRVRAVYCRYSAAWEGTELKVGPEKEEKLELFIEKFE